MAHLFVVTSCSLLPVKMQSDPEILDDVFGQNNPPILYSKSAIVWYSFLFSPLVGGVLMMINLFRVKKRTIGYTVILCAFIYSLGAFFIGTIIAYQASGQLLFLMLNLFGGNILVSPVWRSTIGKMSFIKANGWRPLIFVLLIYFVLGGILFVFNLFIFK